MVFLDPMTQEEYLKLENNEIPLSVSILLDACAFLNISMTELLTGERARLHTYSFVKNGRGLSVDRSKAYKYENLAFNFIDTIEFCIDTKTVYTVSTQATLFDDVNLSLNDILTLVDGNEID